MLLTTSLDVQYQSDEDFGEVVKCPTRADIINSKLLRLIVYFLRKGLQCWLILLLQTTPNTYYSDDDDDDDNLI